ncbi:MAG: amidohydrolase family protein [Opitutaceae bacterium]|nr:amidohydrolase family protein [Opitutaceae bacterium]
MPDFPIVDSHLHIWDPDNLNYPWLSGVSKLNRAFLPDDYRQECGVVDVDTMVFIECDAHPDEARPEVDWVNAQATIDPRIKAIVAFAPLDLGDAVRAHLERLADVNRVRGIRRIYQDETDTEFCLRPKFVEGVRALSEYGLSFDICIKHPHLESSIELVRKCPDTSFVLDHIGKPDIRQQLFEPWRAQMFELAKLDNVVCKLSGVATEADHENWTSEQLHPFIDTAFEAFGSERVMFGGDWPVALSAIHFPRWIEIVDTELAGLSETEARNVFRDTALRFYRII